MDKPKGKDEAEGFEKALDNLLSSIEKRIEVAPVHIDFSNYVRSVQNAFQNQREKCAQFHQILNDMIEDRIPRDDVGRRIEVLFRGHEDLLAEFKIFESVYYKQKNCAEHPVDYVDGLNFVNKVQERFGAESTKYKTFVETLTSLRDNNTTLAEVYSMAGILFQDQQDLLEDFRKFIPRLRIEEAPVHIDFPTYVRSVRNAFQNQRGKCAQFHQILNDMIEDRIARDDVMRRIKVLFRGHKDLLDGFKRFVSVYYKQNNCAKRPVDFVDALNFMVKLKERFGGESTKYKTFLEILMSYRDNNKTCEEVYSMAARLFQDQQDLLEDLRNFFPCLR